MKIAATLFTVLWIVALWLLDRDRERITSPAIWIPTMWLLIVGSRPVSMWLQMNAANSLSARYTEGSPIDAAYFGLVILAGVLVLNRRASQVKSYLIVNYPILLFFFYCAVSLCWADDPMIGFKRWTKAIGDFVMVLILVTDVDPNLAMRRVFARVSFILLPLSALFIRFYPTLGSSFNSTDHVMMYFGVATFKNELGLLCMVCGLTSLWSFIVSFQDRFAERRTHHLVAHGLTIFTAIALVIKADSMTSLSCLALAGAVMIGSTQPYIARRPNLVLGLIAGAVGLALFALFMDTAGTLVSSLGRNASLTGRTQIWAAVLAQPVNPLIGAGFESFWMGPRLQSVWDMSQVGIEEAHNGYLELYLNLGWLGIAALGLLIVTGYRNATAVFHKDAAAGRARLALFTAGLIYSFTEAGFRMMSPIWIAFLLSVTRVPAAAPLQAATISMPLSRVFARKQPTRILQ